MSKPVDVDAIEARCKAAKAAYVAETDAKRACGELDIVPDPWIIIKTDDAIALVARVRELNECFVNARRACGSLAAQLKLAVAFCRNPRMTIPIKPCESCDQCAEALKTYTHGDLAERLKRAEAMCKAYSAGTKEQLEQALQAWRAAGGT